MPRGRFTADERIKAATVCLDDRTRLNEVAQQLEVHITTIKEWMARYKALGPLAFEERTHNSTYSQEVKQVAVAEYLSGGGPLIEVSAKYGLRSASQLRKWVKMHCLSRAAEQSAKSGGSRMKDARATTLEERVEIVNDCLENGRNYADIARKYKVSYNQVYQWVNKFVKLGKAGLEDRRGRRLVSQDPRSEIEIMQKENARLQHELNLVTMERDYLKKLNDIERRDACRK